MRSRVTLRLSRGERRLARLVWILPVLAALALMLWLGSAGRVTAGGPSVQALTNELTILPRLPGSDRNHTASDLNESGLVVGDDETGPVLWTQGAPSRLPVPTGMERALPVAVNNAGQVVGNGATTAGNRAVLWQDGTPVELPSGFSAFDINERGQIAGGLLTNPGSAPALWSPSQPNSADGTLKQLPVPGGFPFGHALAINSFGQVCGLLVSSQGIHRPFLFTPNEPNGSSGKTVLLPIAVGDARGINDRGDVVGVALVESEFRPFLWRPARPNKSSGTVKIFTTDESSTNGAADINNSGMIQIPATRTGVPFGANVVLISDGTAFVTVSPTDPTHRFRATKLSETGAFCGQIGAANSLFAFVGRVSGITGKVEYEKVMVSSRRLETSQRVKRPCANLRVELLRTGTDEVLFTTTTDENGAYTLPGATGSVQLRVRAMLFDSPSSQEPQAVVTLPTDQSKIYEIRSDPFTLQKGQIVGKDLLARDSTSQRVNGPFNILAAVRMGNNLLENLDGALVPPRLTIGWSVSSRDHVVIPSGNFNIPSQL